MKNPHLKEPSVLLVDDDTNTLEVLSDILSEDGYKVKGVKNVSAAEKEISENFYNVVITDLKLPGKSGLELLKMIRSRKKDIAVIILTGYASVDNSMEALNEGAFAYLIKPADPVTLKSFIKKAVNIQSLSQKNKELLRRLKTLSLKDSHTGLYNHRYLTERLSRELARARRHIFPLSLLMIDIDYFKAINDVHGHQYGDKILREVGLLLQDAARENDVVVRFGGEEFVLLLLDTDKEGSLTLGRRLLKQFSRHIFDPGNKKITLTVSIGQTSFPEDGGDSVAELISSADKALSTAKKLGRNRLCSCKDTSLSSGMTPDPKRSNKANINALKEKLIKITERADAVIIESINAFAKTIEARDQYTGEHVRATVLIATELGKRLDLDPGQIKALRHAAVLHDLGKIGISDKILHKKGKLTDEEYDKARKHPQIGADIINPIKGLANVVPMVLYHHERFDGMGYPSGLRGEEIPIGARILAIADVYQALISDRPYRKAYSKKEAIEIIKKGSGSQFCPKVVRAFLQAVGSEEI